MTPHEVAHIYHAHSAGEGLWRARCPTLDGKSADSLSIRSTSDGKTLLKCWGGCPTPEVLNAAGLEWADFFPPPSSSASHPHTRIDPKVALQHRAEAGLRAWKEQEGRIISARVWLRHRLITEGERLIANGRLDRGWDFLQLGYEWLSRLEWLCDLLDSKRHNDWEKTRETEKRRLTVKIG